MPPLFFDKKVSHQPCQSGFPDDMHHDAESCPHLMALGGLYTACLLTNKISCAGIASQQCLLQTCGNDMDLDRTSPAAFFQEVTCAPCRKTSADVP